MPITERTLKRWRKEALKSFDKQLYDTTEAEHLAVCYSDAKEKILRMTQELLDAHLIRKKN